MANERKDVAYILAPLAIGEGPPCGGLLLNLEEVAAIAHALRDAHDAIRGNGGDQYGLLSIEQLKGLADAFEMRLV